MAAVIRLKRRVDEDPLDAFVLNCKRQRTDGDVAQQGAAGGANADVSGETSTVLKFAGTFSEPGSIPTHLQQRLSKDEAKEAISREHRPRFAIRNREALRQNAQNSRFRIVNCTRSLSQVDGVEGATIVDVEKDIVAAAAGPAIAESSSSQEKQPDTVEQDYVYDLYVVDEAQQQRHIPYIPDNLDDISVAIQDNPLYSSHRAFADRSDDSMDEDSEDSNDENNWRNDYPDEDEDEFNDCQSIEDYDMRRAVEDLNLEPDLSSDDDDDDLVYGARIGGRRTMISPTYDDGDDDDDEEYRDAEDDGVNANDVKRFGVDYARFKARVMKQFDKKTNASDSDENNSEVDDGDDRSSASENDSNNSEEDFDLYD
ncbi:probable RNA polymerase II nuclear localization protein SLC7A6OS [Armigeres subalbatus]|uniref:probable RNA polymerase II nuclear localization protein SLC7A6OS n=1 Tax=Armigeres subalbatus TaxID=124917 RepID=UPI002ED2C9FB